MLNKAVLYDRWYVVSLERCPGGFGQWQRAGSTSAADAYFDLGDLINAEFDETGTEYWNLDTDDLPPDVQDIRGLIRQEPDIVFGVRNRNGTVDYYGADCLQTWCDDDNGEAVLIDRQAVAERLSELGYAQA